MSRRSSGTARLPVALVQLQAGEDLSQANFPVLAARDAETLASFKPWADALVSPT